MSELKLCIFNRKFKRKQITEIHNLVQGDCGDLSRTDRLTNLAKIKVLSSDIKVLNQTVFGLMFGDVEETRLSAELDDCASYDQKLIESTVRLEDGIAGVDGTGPVGRSLPNVAAGLKPPVAPLPSYTGAIGESLDIFIRSFEAIVSKYVYSSYEKFVLLRGQISGRARTLIDSLESSKQSYEDAVALLTEALASPVTQKFDTIQRLVDLNMPYDKDPFIFVGEIRILQESFKTLKIDVDFMLQFFIWRAMNNTMQNQFVNITNENKPCLELINKYLFAAVERYQSIAKKYSDKKSSPKISSDTFHNKNAVCSAVNVNYKSKDKKFEPCSLCGADANHPIYKCTKYCDPVSKLERIRSLGGCCCCSYLNHTSSNCKFKFRSKCKFCSGNHFAFLCEKSDSSGNPRGSLSKETSTGVVLTQYAQHSDFNKSNALPTFTCGLGRVKHVRAMLDTGCQTNFVLQSIVKKNKFPIVTENLKLTINGFNSSKDYYTNVVSVPISVGDSVFNVDAVSVPSIDIKLSLPNLGKVVYSLKSNGYVLCDSALDIHVDTIDDIGFIPGSESAYCLPVTSVVFGCPKKSSLLSTPIGILLQGNLNLLLTNMSSLPTVDALSCPGSLTGGGVERLSWSSKYDLSDARRFVCPDGSGDAVGTVNNVVVCDTGDIDPELLDSAVDEILNLKCSKLLNYDSLFDEKNIETNEELVKFALDNTVRWEDGRLQMPLLWNSKVAHFLGTNYNLSYKILHSNLKKLSRIENGLKLTDAVFRDQEESGVIERIHDLKQFRLDNPQCSFLPHMSVMKPERETTKCRVVYLSNLCEKNGTDNVTLCHNQVIHSGPNLNKKLTTSLLLLRFDKFVLTFDIKKAFLNIALSEIDQSRLLLLWFKNVQSDNFEIVAYKAKRLPFGISCSPAILMLALYKILVLDVEFDTPEILNLKKLVYSLIYMDNGACTSNSIDDLYVSYYELVKVFESYKFSLQQFITNCPSLQVRLDAETAAVHTPVETKLFGIVWNRRDDTIFAQKFHLNSEANTKRGCLKSLAENFDPFNFGSPLLNRARMFIHELQCDASHDWDSKLSGARVKCWRNISKQVNSSPNLILPRYLGDRNEKFNIVCFSDASKKLYGCVLYFQNVETLELKFVMSKTRVINKQLENKGIPSLELLAVSLGAECLISLYGDLTNEKCVVAVNIVDLLLYTDSMVSLNWLNSYHSKLLKMQSKRSVFVMNRLSFIGKLCETYPIIFRFISGSDNPADHVTRLISYKLLVNSNYLSGPSFLTKSDHSLDFCELSVTVPAVAREVDQPIVRSEPTHCLITVSAESKLEHVVQVEKYSTWRRVIVVLSAVIKYIHLLKLKTKLMRLNDFSVINFFETARVKLLLTDQVIHFEECVKYFHSCNKKLKDIPNLVMQLNLYRDSAGFLRVKSKCGTRTLKYRHGDPILLSSISSLTRLIVSSRHREMCHAGKYTLLSELRKQYYVPRFFSIVKNVLKNCVKCRRFNERPIQLNQSSYREFRLNPPSIPYRSIFVDYLGPIFVKLNNCKVKVWLLCITCLWSRAINLKICLDLSLEGYLRALQMHVNEYGLPGLILSDSGSQLTAASNLLADFMKDPETKKYLSEFNIADFEFQHYYKGNSSLGSLVEICVKLVKRLLFGAIGKNVLSYLEFEYIVSNTISLVNKRPIAFKEALRDGSLSDVPDPITPELLIHGYELPTVNVNPSFASECIDDPDFSAGLERIKTEYSKLKKVRAKLVDIYNEEFVTTLIAQSTNEKEKYKPVLHKRLSVGDIVLLKEKHTKAADYPMGIVRKIQVNDLDEVTGATILKGKSREIVTRHVNSLILLLSPVIDGGSISPGRELDAAGGGTKVNTLESTSVRGAALRCRHKNSTLAELNLI